MLNAKQKKRLRRPGDLWGGGGDTEAKHRRRGGGGDPEAKHRRRGGGHPEAKHRRRGGGGHPEAKHRRRGGGGSTSPALGLFGTANGELSQSLFVIICK